MAAVLDPRGPSTRRPVSLRRPRSVYGFRIEDPATGAVLVDYVGKTIRPVLVREAEHRGLGRNPDDEQPWSDLIRGRAIVLESDADLEAPWTDEQLAERERCWIRNEEGRLPARPRYNIEHGMDCADRIPKWTAREQRAQRDRAAGIVSRWTSPELFQTVAAQIAVDPVRAGGPSLWSRFWRSRFGRWLLGHLIRAGKVTAALAALWSVAALALWLLADVAPRDAAGGAVAVTGLAVAGWRKFTNPKRRRGPSRRRRTTRRRRT